MTYDKVGNLLSKTYPNGARVSYSYDANYKPDCPLINQDGNVFNLVGIASKTLKDNGMATETREMSSRVFASSSYGEALSIIGDYVNITSTEEPDEDIDEEYEEYFGMEMS